TPPEIDEFHVSSGQTDYQDSPAEPRRPNFDLTPVWVRNRTPRVQASGQTPSEGLNAYAAYPWWLSALDSNREVISTMGITRSYAMRVGPMTPRVPTIFPSTPYGAVITLTSCKGSKCDSPPM